MRIKHFLILTLLIAITFSACETEFDLDATYKDYTIVYGLLEMTEDQQRR